MKQSYYGKLAEVLDDRAFFDDPFGEHDIMPLALWEEQAARELETAGYLELTPNNPEHVRCGKWTTKGRKALGLAG